MKRRSFIGLTSGAIGSSLIVGSGAFNTTRTDREIAVSVVNDVEAYLRLRPLGDENEDGDELGRSNLPDKSIQFRIPGTYEELNGLTEGDGLAPDSEYYFDRLVEVGNQGTNPVTVFTESTSDISQVAIYDSDDEDRPLLTEKNETKRLEPGNDFEAGIYINTHGMDTGEYDTRLTFTAEAVSSN